MLQQVHAVANTESGLLSCRVARIRLDIAKLKPDHRKLFYEIRMGCPSCENPERCAADLAALPPDSGLEDWDEYCPNAAKLRILAALTMFSSDVQ